MGISLAFKIFILLAICLLLVQCVRKKKNTENLESWLKVHYQEKLKVIETHSDNIIRNWSFKVKKSVIADSNDSLLQIQIKWDAREPGLGISKEEIDRQFDKARIELQDAKSLFEELKASGMTSFSAGIQYGDAYILVFKPATPEQRQQDLRTIKKACDSWKKTNIYNLWIQLMEPAGFQKEFGDIIPLAHWVRLDSWHSRNMILSLNKEAGFDFDLPSMDKEWQFNTESDLLLKWIEKSRPLAESWAKSHIKKHVEFNAEVAYESLNEMLGAKLRYPFHNAGTSDSAAVDGYVEGDYLFDRDSFQNIKFAKE